MEDKKEKKDFLYRIMPVKRVKELFETGELVFIKPDSWKDPFENFLSKVSFIDNTGKGHHIEYLNNVYGQCYSLGSETSLMWDAYTPEGNGVRIKIEAEKLIVALKNHHEYNGDNFYFGKVEYKRYGDFISRLKDEKQLKQLYYNQGNSLMKFFYEKRYEYRDERENRIMYDANSDHKDYGKRLRIRVQVLDLIDSVRFDPKMSEKDCEDLKVYFKSKGMDGRRIHRSLLYKYEVKKRIQLN